MHCIYCDVPVRVLIGACALEVHALSTLRPNDQTSLVYLALLCFAGRLEGFSNKEKYSHKLHWKQIIQNASGSKAKDKDMAGVSQTNLSAKELKLTNVLPTRQTTCLLAHRVYP